MTKYRNPRIEAEMNEAKEEEVFEKEMEIPAVSVEEEQWKNRYAELRRYNQKQQDEAKREIEQLRAEVQRIASKSVQPPASDEDIEAWKAKYPEFARILTSSIAREVEKATADSKKELNRIKEKEQELTAREARQMLQKLHPDLDTLFAKGSDFEAWLRKQPQKTQDKIFRSLDVDDANLVLLAYKAQVGGPKTKVVEKDTDSEEAAKVVRKAPASAKFEGDGDYDFSESQIQEQSKRNKRWFEQNEEKIMEAHRKGRILMDLTGGAR